ncbi:hypothetical protein [Amycolatopsis sp. NBRC 101858]|uniref:hypothetical protein n=1 Tax=Amycolatopsis sp. NBRC 101858 TaxID=3032200 RepID=UPI00255635F4|nr:hypothetical protein [Amycolatopsis sp. NBRC 101858]
MSMPVELIVLEQQRMAAIAAAAQDRRRRRTAFLLLMNVSSTGAHDGGDVLPGKTDEPAR